MLAMTKSNTPKKPVPEDWHPADIVAALRKAGWSTRRLSVHHGLHPSACAKAMHEPWLRCEQLIADAIGLAPETIWPARYAKRAQHTTRTGHARTGREDAA